MNKLKISEQYRNLQVEICEKLEALDNGIKFIEDPWNRNEGGGGFTRTVENGQILEKGGVAFSEVYGELTQQMKTQLRMTGNSFFACGVSIVLHPLHPLHPIIHMNVRYFELDSGEYWFGGGIDLTPHYINEGLAKKFHEGLKSFCDSYDTSLYPEFKRNADDYFFLPHRGESRGIGGVFYDHKHHENCPLTKEQLLDFSYNLGLLFPRLYREQIQSAKVMEPSLSEINWQRLRRGRYVEFNLLHDRGTKFGIYSGGRTESILLSMPPQADWKYNFIPESNSEEEKTLELLKKRIDWISH